MQILTHSNHTIDIKVNNTNAIVTILSAQNEVKLRFDILLIDFKSFMLDKSETSYQLDDGLLILEYNKIEKFFYLSINKARSIDVVVLTPNQCVNIEKVIDLALYLYQTNRRI